MEASLVCTFLDEVKNLLVVDTEDRWVVGIRVHRSDLSVASGTVPGQADHSSQFLETRGMML